MGKKTMTEIRESGIIMGRGLEHMELTGIPLCTKCLKPYVQVADYEFKPVCKCHPENWRLMVGGKMSEKKTWLEFTDCSEEGMKTKKFIVKNKV